MRIGIIGAGQLGLMLGVAARRLGHACTFLDPADAPPAASIGPVIRRPFDDAAAIEDLAARSDVLTYEFENVSVDTLATFADQKPVYPPVSALRQSQDRLAEKALFKQLDIPLPPFRPVDGALDLQQAQSDLGLPLVIKTRRMGYDGKGQAMLQTPEAAAAVLDKLGGRRLIAEQWVKFDFEISAIGVRSMDGHVATYPLTQNEHADGILRVSRAPVQDDRLTVLANDYLKRLLNELNYVGVLALEMFVVGERLFANEFAPRVHNSGHWTIEGAETSQFENHVRAITGSTPGSTGACGFAGMVNLIGKMPTASKSSKLTNRSLHDYGKSPRAGRKLGHMTVVSRSPAERDREIREILDLTAE